jgi:hypothetical protein
MAVRSQDAAESVPPSARQETATAGWVEVEFTRKGSMRMTLKEDVLELDTTYGELKIPIKDIVRIDFATRLSEADAKAIEAAIAGLASSDYAVREAATRRLADLAERAYPALLRAAQDSDAEVAKRAAAIVAKLKETLPPERLAVRDYDVVETTLSRIAGKLRATTIAVETAEFGGHPLRLADIRSLRSQQAPAATLAYIKPEPDPGNMSRFQGAMGQTMAFTVTGRGDGSCYGTGLYTTDSLLATAAVHCGVLKAGETAVVHVQIVPPPATFVASTQNGITSNSWSSYPAAYRILGKGPATP